MEWNWFCDGVGVKFFATTASLIRRNPAPCPVGWGCEAVILHCVISLRMGGVQFPFPLQPFVVLCRTDCMFELILRNFDDLLTVCLSIFISIFNQLDPQNLFHNKFNFMPLHASSTCSSSGGQNCITQSLVSSDL